MNINDERIRDAVIHTEILRTPKQSLATFGVTNIYYYLVTEPVYKEFEKSTETVIREGRVVAERPRVVTPYYLTRLEGFSAEARKYFDMLAQIYGASCSGIYYAYKNEPKEMNIVSDSLITVVEKLNQKIDQSGDALASIIKGKDELWDVSLMKFIFEITRNSVGDNMSQLGSRGLLNVDADGVPGDARLRIEHLFKLVLAGECKPRMLKDELERWGLFEKYEDRFLSIFTKGR